MSSPSVSVVDDDAEVRAALTRLVASAGYQPLAYGGGDAFLRDVEARRPCCVVLDLQMPGIGGFDVLRALAQRQLGVPVIVITGYDSDQARGTAQTLGARAYLCKPVDDRALLAAIGDAIAAP
ncbi:MAG TPA: response regulator [Burkholderiaceae bacterium]|nr:response regulator [Burkholderiaceae bacterium]